MAENTGWIAKMLNELLRDITNVAKKLDKLLSADKKDYQVIKAEIETLQHDVNVASTKIVDLEKNIALILEYVAPPPPPPLPVKFIVTTEVA